MKLRDKLKDVQAMPHWELNGRLREMERELGDKFTLEELMVLLSVVVDGEE